MQRWRGSRPGPPSPWLAAPRSLFACSAASISRAFQAAEVCLPSCHPFPLLLPQVPPGLEACSRCSVTTGMACHVPWMSVSFLLPSPARERRGFVDSPPSPAVPYRSSVPSMDVPNKSSSRQDSRHSTNKAVVVTPTHAPFPLFPGNMKNPLARTVTMHRRLTSGGNVGISLARPS
jgi:hypothetical protein